MIDVEKLAKLARVKLDSDEKEKLQKDFEAILAYINKLQKADLSVTAEETDLANDNKNILREDDNAHNAGKFSKDLLGEAPSKEDNFIKVKHVFE